MSFRPTTIERAYQLAGRWPTAAPSATSSRSCRAEGHERVQENLYGASLTGALRKLCQKHYVPSGDDAAGATSDDEDDGDDD